MTPTERQYRRTTVLLWAIVIVPMVVTLVFVYVRFGIMHDSLSPAPTVTVTPLNIQLPTK